uniref:Uncharacterized protein n=1 Tax=Micrurus surinamensis TaxID=129470 RepID=A0A2D4Q2U8_MICSU
MKVVMSMPSCRAINEQSRTPPGANNNMFNCIIIYLPTISINKISLVNNLSFFQFFQQLVKMSDVPLCFFFYLFPYNIAPEADETVLDKQKTDKLGVILPHPRDHFSVHKSWTNWKGVLIFW